MSDLDISADELQWARTIDPQSVIKLANFVKAENYSVEEIARACRKHRQEQEDHAESCTEQED